MMGEGTIHEAVLSLLLMEGFSRRRIVGILRPDGSERGPGIEGRLFTDGPPDLASVCGMAGAKRVQARRLLETLADQGVHTTCLGDPDYPGLLKQIHEPPPLLFYKGSLAHQACGSVAIVGSRKASLGGIRFAFRLAEELGGLGFTVVSGLARGIDTASHRGALETGGRTIAVLGSGIDITYPPENEGLARAIASSGAVVTELLPGTQPLRCNFPQRNRIISGLSLGTVVIEAGERSGALITAACALEQNRSVFAVPGTPGYYGSKGTNSLIRQGARLVETVEDVLEEIAPQLEVARPKVRGPAEQDAPDGAEARVLELLSAVPVHVDEICRNLDLECRDVINVLFRLETKGFVKSMPGKFYVREDSIRW
jgi:DNA processing protein